MRGTLMSTSAETARELTRRTQAVREGEMNDHYGKCRKYVLFSEIDSCGVRLKQKNRHLVGIRGWGNLHASLLSQGKDPRLKESWRVAL